MTDNSRSISSTSNQLNKLNKFLIQAAYEGKLNILKKLISYPNISLYYLNNNGNTAFHIAAAEGHVDCVAALIQAGMDVNLSNSHQVTALHFAVRNNHLSVVKYLVGLKSLSLNVQDSNGDTPLHDAAENEDIDISITEALINAGASFSVKNYEDLDPIDVANNNDNDEVLVLLEEIKNDATNTPSKHYLPSYEIKIERVEFGDDKPTSGEHKPKNLTKLY